MQSPKRMQEAKRTESTAMRNLKITMAYDGSNFLGWQQQKIGRTVEGEILKALQFMHNQPLGLHAAGRTDTGVHASGQVINFVSNLDGIPLQRYARAFNSFLPLDIRAKYVEEKPESFHARYHARERSYKYYILSSELHQPHYRFYCHRVVHKPSLTALNRLARAFVGTHDFSTFSSPSEQNPNPERTVYNASFAIEGPFLVFHVVAQSFLWRMVRSMVGSLLTFEQESISIEELKAKINAKDRTQAGPTAPATGLYLHQVRYKDEHLVY